MPAFERKLNSKGSLTVPVFVDSQHNKVVDLREFTQSAKYSWALAYGTNIAQAGPVWSHTFDDASRKLTVTCGGIFSLFSRRVVRTPDHTVPDWPPTTAANDVSYEDFTFKQIMMWLVFNNTFGRLGVSGNVQGSSVPIDFPGLSSAKGGGSYRTYYAYDLATVEQRVLELSQLLTGPEFDFRPFFAQSENQVRWAFDVGNPRLGLTYGTTVWDYGSMMETIDVDSNGATAPISRVWVKGAGQERDLRTGYHFDLSPTNSGFPLLDYVDTQHTSAEVESTLHSWAWSTLQSFQKPLETWSCSVRIDRDDELGFAPLLASPLGNEVTISVDAHPWVPNGMYQRRIIGFSNDGNNFGTVQVEFAPTPGGT